MALLIETPKATDANSYATVLRADEVLGFRLYADKWTDAGTTPDAEDYQSSASATLGDTTITIDTGTGTLTAGSLVQFSGHTTLYTVASALTGAGTMTFTPALTANVADNEAIARKTANEKEKALIWATTLFDNLLVYEGSAQTLTQRLRWPRTGVTDADGEFYDYDTIPELLEEATAEMALVLLTSNKFELPGILGKSLSKAKLGPIDVSVDKNELQPVIPPNILALLSPLGALETEAQVGSNVLPLRRV